MTKQRIYGKTAVGNKIRSLHRRQRMVFKNMEEQKTFTLRNQEKELKCFGTNASGFFSTFSETA